MTSTPPITSAAKKMDLDQFLKVAPIVSTAFFSALTLWLTVRQYLDGTKNARREEYKFAKLLFDDLKANPDMHAFPRKKGFQAIGRNKDLPPSVVEHLMTLQDPVTALSDYEFSRSYLKHFENLGRRQLAFAGSGLFSTERRRNFVAGIYALLAILFYVLAFAPWLAWALGEISGSVAVSWTVVISPFGIWAAAFLFLEFIQLRRAIRLVNSQNQQADAYESGPHI